MEIWSIVEFEKSRQNKNRIGVNGVPTIEADEFDVGTFSVIALCREEGHERSPERVRGN